MGPCLRRGLRGSVFLSHKHRFPGMRRRVGERRCCHPGKSGRIYPGPSTWIAPSLYWVPDICSRKFRDDRKGRGSDRPCIIGDGIIRRVAFLTDTGESQAGVEFV